MRRRPAACAHDLPPPRAGIARASPHARGRWQPPTTITGSQVEWMPRVRRGADGLRPGAPLAVGGRGEHVAQDRADVLRPTRRNWRPPATR